MSKKAVSIDDKIALAIEKYSMLESTSHIIVAVSGGADSMALLDYLRKNSGNLKVRVSVAHFNHMLRGEESERDEQLVRNYCKKHNIKIDIKREDVFAKSRLLSLGIEECGRNLRYAFFDELADKYDAKIATGHTLSDKIETLIFNITRGSSLKGIASIPEVRGKIIRPLINLSRKETEMYCRDNSVAFVNDSSNFSKAYTRNLIRLDVIPTLKQINPSLESSLQRLMNLADEDEKFLGKIAYNIYIEANIDGKLDISLLQNKELPILRRVVKLFLQDRNVNYNYIENICDIIRGKNSYCNISDGYIITVEKNLLTINKPKAKSSPFSMWQTEFKIGEIETQQGRKFTVELIKKENFEKNKNFSKKTFKNILDYDTISHKLVFRNRLPQDMFSPAGRKAHKKLKKLFTELKIPEDIRKDLLILEADGEIVWVERIGVSQVACVTKNTKNILLLSKKGAY